MTLMGAYYSGMKINALDITPNYAGTTTSLVNGIAAISAIITPYLIGMLAPDVSTYSTSVTSTFKISTILDELVTGKKNLHTVEFTNSSVHNLKITIKYFKEKS